MELTDSTMAGYGLPGRAPFFKPSLMRPRVKRGHKRRVLLSMNEALCRAGFSALSAAISRAHWAYSLSMSRPTGVARRKSGPSSALASHFLFNLQLRGMAHSGSEAERREQGSWTSWAHQADDMLKVSSNWEATASTGAPATYLQTADGYQPPPLLSRANSRRTVALRLWC